jgi:hypothetical protein
MSACEKVKGKASPVTGRVGPWWCERSWVPHFLDNRFKYGGEAVSPALRPPFTHAGKFLILISVRGRVEGP